MHVRIFAKQIEDWRTRVATAAQTNATNGEIFFPSKTIHMMNDGDASHPTKTSRPSIPCSPTLLHDPPVVKLRVSAGSASPSKAIEFVREQNQRHQNHRKLEMRGIRRQHRRTIESNRDAILCLIITDLVSEVCVPYPYRRGRHLACHSFPGGDVAGSRGDRKCGLTLFRADVKLGSQLARCVRARQRRARVRESCDFVESRKALNGPTLDRLGWVRLAPSLPDMNNGRGFVCFLGSPRARN